MPELPDVVLYIEAVESRTAGARLRRLRIDSPFVLRTTDPAVEDFEGRVLSRLRRLGKRIVLEFEDSYFAVLHLMIAGRLHWRDEVAARAGRSRTSLAAFEFDNGVLTLTEAGTKKRASIHLVRGEEALRTHDPGGIDVLEADAGSFRLAILRENHTLKRALTDPRLFSGIGNAYSDEILHRAGLSPVRLTQKLTDEEIGLLYHATQSTLHEWIDRLRQQAGGQFPEKVTAFRPEMAVHGKFGEPCPVCGTKVQRIVYAENETNYCPACQTGGKILRDRSLSRILRDDWPKSVEELERDRLP